MRLTTFSDYALRLLILCADKAEGQVTIAEAAGAYRISKNHLMKVANELVRAGFLSSTRGRGGGLRLAMPADQIRIGAVIRHIEGSPGLVECMTGKNACVITSACKLKGLLASALQDFFNKLDSATLADLASGPSSLRPARVPAQKKRAGEIPPL